MDFILLKVILSETGSSLEKATLQVIELCLLSYQTLSFWALIKKKTISVKIEDLFDLFSLKLGNIFCLNPEKLKVLYMKEDSEHDF